MKNSYVSWLFLQKNADILFDKRKPLSWVFWPFWRLWFWLMVEFSLHQDMLVQLINDQCQGSAAAWTGLCLASTFQRSFLRWHFTAWALRSLGLARSFDGLIWTDHPFISVNLDFWLGDRRWSKILVRPFIGFFQIFVKLGTREW